MAEGELTLERADAWLKNETGGGGADLGQFALSEPEEVEQHRRARQGIEVGWMNETGLSVICRDEGVINMWQEHNKDVTKTAERYSVLLSVGV